MNKYKTVKDLREALAQFPNDTVLLMSEDGEGNSFRPYWELSVGTFDKNEPDYPLDEDDVAANPDQYDPTSFMVAIILWPSY